MAKVSKAVLQKVREAPYAIPADIHEKLIGLSDEHVAEHPYLRGQRDYKSFVLAILEGDFGKPRADG